MVSSRAENGSPLSSRWHHVAMTSVPPGFSTRTISSTYFFLSGMCSPDSHAHTRSNELSGKSIASAFMTRKSALRTPCCSANSVARATCFGDRVMPVTDVPSPKPFARWRDAPPIPHPTSSTVLGVFSAQPAQMAISSTKSSLASTKSFTLHPSNVPAPRARTSSV